METSINSGTDSQEQNPHQREQVLTTGVPADQARYGLVLIHGRGSTAQEILGLVRAIGVEGLFAVAPQAANNVWYPNRFNTPVEGNEPWLTWALARVSEMVAYVASAGIPQERIVVAGFSQGACLALEWLARTGTRVRGVVGLSGGMIENGDKPREYDTDLLGAHVFLGCSDIDFHIPLERVERSAELLGAMGAQVEKRIYPNMGHTINKDEIEHIRSLFTQVE